MRVELSPEISVTIVTLGFIESEMTQGKGLSKEGVIQVNPEVANVRNKTYNIYIYIYVI